MIYKSGCVIQTVESDIKYQYSVRAMVVIGGASAQHDYDFSFTLPNGYAIMTAAEYNNQMEAEEGYLNIVNTNVIHEDEESSAIYTESMFVIEPAWAKDADGNDVAAHYEINGATITQLAITRRAHVYAKTPDIYGRIT